MPLFYPGLIPATDTNDDPIVGATWNFYLQGTTTATAVYSDAALTTSVGATVTAGSGGRFVNIFYDAGIATRAILKDAGGATLRDLDPLDGDLLTNDGLIKVSAFGAFATATEDHSTNHQPAIDAALTYVEANGAAGLQFEDGFYSIWTPLRTEAPAANVNFNINNDKTGVPFVISSGVSMVWKSGPNKTTFIRRKNDGTLPRTFSGTQQLTSGQYWRGGMFLLSGTVSPAATQAVVKWSGTWDIDGGMGARSGLGLQALVSGMYVLDGSGNGWDISDKPIWNENDRHAADVEFEGHVHIHGFRGEMLYVGGAASIRWTGTLETSDTDGSGLNAGNWYHLRGDTLHIHDCYLGLEGNTGDERSWIKRVVGADCTTFGGLRAGKWLDSPTAVSPTPSFHIGELILHKSTSFGLLRYTHIDKAVLTDMTFKVGVENSSDQGLAINSTVNELTVMADTIDVNPAVQWSADDTTPGTLETRRNHIGRLTVGRTPNAIANSKSVLVPVTTFAHSFGPDNFVHEICGEAGQFPASSALSHPIGFGQLRMIYLTNDFGLSQDINPTGDLDYRTTPYVAVYEDPNLTTGLKTVTLLNYGGATPPPRGSLWTIRNACGRPIAVAISNTRMPTPALVPIGSKVQFEFDNYYWTLVSPREALRATATYNPANLVDGTGATTTVTLVGAVLGMKAEATFSLDLQGITVTAWVSTADTVSVRFQNETGGDLDLASGTLTVNVEYA